jgi:hypothetical protein
VNSGDGTPISVYLELEEGEHADWEIVSKASLELIAALKDLAEFADPSWAIKVSLQNSEEGSLRFNAILELFGGGGDPGLSEEKRKTRRTVLKAVLAGATLWLLDATAAHYYDKVLAAIDAAVIEMFQQDKEEAKPEPIEEAKQECRTILEGAARSQVGVRHARRFFSELKADKNIKGVGVALDHRSPPVAIIPRAEFADRSRPPQEDAEPTARTRVETVTVLLVEPRLLGDDKAWRFSIAGMEFSAKIEDKDFVEATLSGRNHIPLVEGIYLTVRMRIEEKQEDNAWTIKSRTILEVLDVRARPGQGSLPGTV